MCLIILHTWLEGVFHFPLEQLNITYKWLNTKVILVIKMGVVWIGPNVLGKTYDQNINVPNNYARTVGIYIN